MRQQVFNKQNRSTILTYLDLTGLVTNLSASAIQHIKAEFVSGHHVFARCSLGRGTSRHHRAAAAQQADGGQRGQD